MKTAKDILDAKGIQFPASRSPRDYNLTLIAMQEYAEAYALERTQKWISVKERLPEKSSVYSGPGHYVNNVLAATDKGRVYETTYCALGWANERGETVTHWQNLPEPPKI